MDALCRDCFQDPGPGGSCRHCGGRRLLRHAELFALTIAHVDCDAFYASVEKRDRPELASRPVVVGGARRGVVSAACYVARGYGIHSAMPMFKALKACPDAVVIKPDMAKYVAEARRIRAMMEALTPLVAPLSIDEAVLDLAGTERLHRAPPAAVLARFARQVEQEVGVTVSIGLAGNRLMAKLAAERDKPRGFAVIGRSEAAAWLAPQRVGLLPGIGPAAVRRLEAMGITRLGQLGSLDDRTAVTRLGPEGPALAARARGEDHRSVSPDRETKSVSAETTFDEDLAGLAELEAVLWRICERLAKRLAAKELAAGGLVLKLKTAGFETITRSARLPAPTLLPDTMFAAARPLLAKAADGTRYRLLGLGAAPLAEAADADRGDLADPSAPRRAAKWRAIEALRGKFGAESVVAGRALGGRRKG